MGKCEYGGDEAFFSTMKPGAGGGGGGANEGNCEQENAVIALQRAQHLSPLPLPPRTHTHTPVARASSTGALLGSSLAMSSSWERAASTWPCITKV